MIYYEKYGSDSSPVMILLHGTNFVHCFSKQCAKLSDNFCLVVPHLPGFGRSSGETFSTESAVLQVAELAESFGKKVTLMGFSLGAQLCLPLLCAYEDIWNGAVMISPWLIKENADIDRLMKQYADNEKAIRSGTIPGLGMLTNGLDRDDSREHKEFCQTVTMKSILASVDNGIILSDYPEYAELKIPMLALCGIKEMTDIRKSVRALVQQNQNCTYDMWDGAAHNIPVKYASRLNKVVEEFMINTVNRG